MDGMGRAALQWYGEKPSGMHGWVGWDGDGMGWERAAMGWDWMKRDGMGWDGRMAGVGQSG